MIIAMISSPAGSQNRGKVLVLGFDSPYFNEIQDRLLRESVMKEFITRGYSVIPVMEVESLILEEGINKFRKASQADMKDFCRRLDADIAVNGKVAVAYKTAVKSKSIDPAIPYACRVTVFIKQKDKLISENVFTEGNNDLYGFIKALSIEIAGTAAAMIDK